MPELTLESIAQRVDELERRLDVQSASTIRPRRDWREVVGISERTAFSQELIAEMAALREADHQSATVDG